MSPSVSVIVTCYNVEAYVATAMQSVIDADLPDLELIVVDDGSKDMTRNVIDATAQAIGDRARIRTAYFRANTPGGVATAANFGLDLAKGDLIVFVDGDDWVLPRGLARAVTRLIETGDDMLVTDCQEYWNTTADYTFYPEGLQWAALTHAFDIEARREILFRMAPFPWRKIYRRDFLERHRIRFPVGDYMFEDNPFHWEVTLKAERFSFLREVTHVHRMDRPGQSVTNAGARSIAIFPHYDTIRGMLIREGRLDAMQPILARWLLRHIVWCADRVPPGYLNRVFDLALPRLKALEPDLVWAILPEMHVDARDVRRLTAAMLGDRMGFLANAEPEVR